MRLGETTKKQLLKIVYRRHKIVASCGFLEISSSILTIDSSKVEIEIEIGFKPKSKSKPKSVREIEIEIEIVLYFRS